MSNQSINGVFLLDKPTDCTSNHVLQKVKRLFAAKKAGHTGSLDPIATGMLPICLGEATKYSQFLLDADKCYQVTACLGSTTTTQDRQGEVLIERPHEHIDEQQIKQILGEFLGELEQVPPMYSALKHNGVPLYKLARKGKEVARKARRVHIYELELLSVDLPYFSLRVKCSKGTYIRSLVEDIGERLQAGAHVTQLHRLYSSPYENEKMISLHALESLSPEQRLDSLLPVSSMVSNLKTWQMTEEESKRLYNGLPICVNNSNIESDMELVCLSDNASRFFGVGELSAHQLKAKRLMAVRE